MKISIDVDIPESIIQNVISETVHKAFSCNQYSGNGVGYNSIVQQTQGVIKMIDFSQEIKNEIDRQIKQGIISGIIRESLKREIRQVVKEMKQESGLFHNVQNGTE